MPVTPRHLAAAQYTILGAYSLAVWWGMLTPIATALEQLKSTFAASNELQAFFVCTAISTLFTVVIAIGYYFKQAASRPLASVLLGGALLLFALSVWRFDSVFVLAYGFGLLCAAWSWSQANTAVKER